ncbi:MAG: 3-keto-5-aminohexanoate cleavage protein [Cocleimonas sp.]
MFKKRGGCFDSAQQNCHLIAVAPNGARKLLSDHPHIPLDTNHIATTAKDCLVAGASMIHLHVRDDSGRHSLSVNLYQQAIVEINKATDSGIFIQVTSEAVGKYTAVEQFAMIHALKPDAVSIALREIKSLDEKIISHHFKTMRQANIAPQLILYNQTDLSLYRDWLNRGVIVGKAFPILFVIGKEQLEGSFDNTILRQEFIRDIPNSSWMVCAFGENEFHAGKLAAEIGGHIRLGFENNCLLDSGVIAKSNAEIIEQMAKYLSSNNLNLANLEQTKKLMRPDW